jgi:competence protein CoiA
MKYAILNGEKIEATKGSKGFCPSCGSELIAKCGNVNINHWAHKGERTCDLWWENETDWHRTWKNNFPVDWQEVVQRDESGEKHIADVKTKRGWVIEFQHSYLKPDEQQSRNNFYKRIVWVVDGRRRKRDKQQFYNAICEQRLVSVKPLIHRVHFIDEYRILNEWNKCNAIVLFDIPENEIFEESFLWLLLHHRLNSDAFLMQLSRNEFIKRHLDGSFDEIIGREYRSTCDNPPSNVGKIQSQARSIPNYFQRREAWRNRFNRL